MNTRIVAVCLWLGTGLVVNGAQAGQDIAPDQIVSATLAHSPALQSAEKEMEAAQARKSQADARALPFLTFDASAARYTGLRESELGPSVVIPALEDRYAASVTLSQPLYTGGSVSGQKEGAEFQKRASAQNLRGTQADLTLAALTTYWNWSMSYYALNSLQSAVARMEQHATDMHNLHSAGLATDNDALATDVLLDQTRLRMQTAQRGTEIARAQIAYLTGQDLPTEAVPIQASTEPMPAVLEESEAVTIAMTNRPERAARQLELEAAKSQHKVSRADLFPHVYLTAQYEEANPNNLFFPPEDQWNDDGFAGVTVTWSILDWGLTQGKAREAQARADQARLRLTQQEELILLDVREARTSLQNARDRVPVTESAEKSARRNLDAATDLWKNGLARHSDVLDAHAQLTDAQFQSIAARADVELALATLKHAIGKLDAAP